MSSMWQFHFPAGTRFKNKYIDFSNAARLILKQNSFSTVHLILCDVNSICQNSDASFHNLKFRLTAFYLCVLVHVCVVLADF